MSNHDSEEVKKPSREKKDETWLMDLKIPEPLFTHEERRKHLKKIYKMVRALHSSANNSPERKKPRYEIPQSDKLQARDHASRIAQMEAQLRRELRCEPSETIHSSSKTKSKEQLNLQMQREYDFSYLHDKPQESSNNLCEKVLSWMDYNDKVNKGARGNEPMPITNSLERRLAMERILQLVRNLNSIQKPSQCDDNSKLEQKRIIKYGPNEYNVGRTEIRYGRSEFYGQYGLEFGRPDFDIGPAAFNFTRTGIEFTNPDTELTLTYSELGQESENGLTDSEITLNDSDLLSTESETDFSETDIAEEADETQNNSEPANTDTILRSLDELVNTPEITSDSSGQETFYSCESQIID